MKDRSFSRKIQPWHQIRASNFLEKTKGLAQKDGLELSKSNSVAIHKFFRPKEGPMGKAITKVRTEYANDGTVTKTANLLSQYYLVTLDSVQQAAHKHFNVQIANDDPIPDAPFKARDLDPATFNY